MKKTKQKAGTSLIEIVLYFTLLTIVMGAIMGFAVQMIDMNKKSDNLHDTLANLEFITGNIVLAIQTANTVDVANSIFDNNAGKLSLNMHDPQKSPTQYYVQDYAVYLKKGGGQPVKISTNSIKCTVLRFQKISQPKLPDQINVAVAFEPLYKEMPNLTYPIQIHTSASLRK